MLEYRTKRYLKYQNIHILLFLLRRFSQSLASQYGKPFLLKGNFISVCNWIQTLFSSVVTWTTAFLNVDDYGDEFRFLFAATVSVHAFLICFLLVARRGEVQTDASLLSIHLAILLSDIGQSIVTGSSVHAVLKPLVAIFNYRFANWPTFCDDIVST